MHACHIYGQWRHLRYGHCGCYCNGLFGKNSMRVNSPCMSLRSCSEVLWKAEHIKKNEWSDRSPIATLFLQRFSLLTLSSIRTSQDSLPTFYFHDVFSCSIEIDHFSVIDMQPSQLVTKNFSSPLTTWVYCKQRTVLSSHFFTFILLYQKKYAI